MIISEQHKYLFIEVPHTGSTAISSELQEMYERESILKKHSSFYDFRAHFGSRAKDFVIFATVRNPIDEAASVFLKFANNHKGNYTNKDNALDRGGWISARQRRAYENVARHGSFREFLSQFYNLPFTSAINVNRQFCDRILRFETLEADFASTLEALHINTKRPLPVRNTTANSEEKARLIAAVEMETYSATFGAFMQEWGYTLPTGAAPVVSMRERAFYEMTKSARNAFAVCERRLPKFVANAVRNAAG